VVADDGSLPGHVQALRAGRPDFPCPLLHVWHPDAGFTAGRARNLGALHAQADYVVFLDGDCVPSRRFVSGHRQLAEPGFFVNGSRVLLSQRLSAQALAGHGALQGLHAADWLRWRAAGDINKLTHLLYWPGAPHRVERRFHWKGIRSCNFGVWYRDLEATNGFDESFSGWGHEDADLVLRLHNHGSLRKNGAFATEVFHLWHPDNSRDQEASNRERVLQRLHNRITRAEIGLAQAARAGQVIVTELN
jgi:GT2 family glycosyltransferase